MKKFTVLVFAVFYLLSTLSWSMNVHFCCGKFDSVSLSEKSWHDGHCKSPRQDDGCCKTTKVTFLKNDNHKSPDTPTFSLPDFFKYVEVPMAPWPSAICPATVTNFIPRIFSHRPPRPPGVPIYLSNQVFRI